MNVAAHIKDPHVIAAFNDMAIRGAADFVVRVLMIIRNKTTEEVLFKVTQTGLLCLARLLARGRRKSRIPDGLYRACEHNGVR